jgi:hypothetical protein
MFRNAIAAVLLLIVSSCASFEAETPGQKIYAIQGEFNTYMVAALKYTTLPTCLGSTVVGCYDPKVKDSIVRLARDTRGAIATARMYLDAPTAGSYVALAGTALNKLAVYMASKEIRP